MDLSSIPVVTADGDSVEVVICGSCVGTIMVSLSEETEFLAAVQADSRGEVGSIETLAWIKLSTSERTGTLKPPSAGHWRVAFPASKVDSVTARVVPAGRTG